MTQYNTLNSQLNKLKSAIKNGDFKVIIKYDWQFRR